MAQSGNIPYVAWLPLPALPGLVSEWTAIIPLVCHLISYRGDYIITGEVALSKAMSVGLFPRLGTLAGFARLLSRGSDFLDRASTRGGASSTVWDVKWGSVFPSANGAATSMIDAYAAGQRRYRTAVMPDRLPVESRPPGMDDSKSSSEKPIPASKDDNNVLNHSVRTSNNPITAQTMTCSEDPAFRRYQTLNVYQFSFRQQRRNGRFSDAYISLITSCTSLALAVLAAVLAGLCGMYGTAGLLATVALSKAAAHSVELERPPGYLQSNESYNDAFMLVAAHPNSTDWTLYVGERGIVDSLLNKTMVTIPTTRRNVLIAHWLRCAHVLQLLSMTFVAAAKGWDGVGMLIAMLADRLCHALWCDARLGRRWLERESVNTEARQFLFSGRTVMLGAIQLSSGSSSSTWMDGILTPHPRRDAWLRALQGNREPDSTLSDFDQKWVALSSGLSKAAAVVMVRNQTLANTSV